MQYILAVTSSAVAVSALFHVFRLNLFSFFYCNLGLRICFFSRHVVRGGCLNFPIGDVVEFDVAARSEHSGPFEGALGFNSKGSNAGPKLQETLPDL